MGTDPICPHDQKTFEESEAFAKAKGGRLCTPREILLLRLSLGHLSDDWSYAAARDRSNNPQWVEVSKQESAKRVVNAKDVKWTADYNSF